MRNLAITIFLTYIFFLNISATTLTDDFESGLNGWSTSQGTLTITTQGTSVLDFQTSNPNSLRSFSKIYSFGILEANTAVTITFDAWATGGWESSDGSIDYIYLNVNGTNVINQQTFPGANGSTSPLSNSYNVSGTTDASGNVTLLFTIDVSSTGEHLQIDNVSLVTPLTTINAVNDSLTTTINTPVSGNVLINDIGAQITVVSTDFSGLTGGTVTAFDNGTGAFTYTPNASFTGTDTFTYTIEDNTSNQDVGSVTITVELNTNFTCANPASFSSVFSTSVFGNLQILGNTSLCADNNQDGTCEDPGATNNNSIFMINNDVDGDPATTVNSSAAQLVMPSDATVLYAGLYWQGYLNSANQATKQSATSIKYKFDGNSYTTASASGVDFNWVYFNASRFYYQGYLDITSYVTTNGAGKYWVGDIISDTGSGIPGGGFGGWALVVVYESPSEPLQNLTVFRGYEAIAGSGDITNAQSYATANSCVGPTGVGNNVSTTVSGFLTPKSAPVNSSLAVFAGEGDRSLTGDTLSLTNKAGTAINLTNGANPATNVMNSSISNKGNYVTTGDPYYSTNSLGIDVDLYDTSAIMDTEQTSTIITLTTSGDGYFPSVYAFSAELYEPQFCFDYDYRQFNTSFREDNNGTEPPYISGRVQSGEDIAVTLYVRNNEDSDVTARNMLMDIVDINTSQAIYSRNTTEVTPPNSIIRTPISDSSLSVADSFIKNIPISDIKGKEYFYMDYRLDPSALGGGTNDINISIDANLRYDLVIPIPSGPDIIIPTTTRLGGGNTPLCTASTSYLPIIGRFNVVDSDLYNYITRPYYNIPTQVTKRPGNFKLVSFDPINLDVQAPLTTMVAVDLIDVGGFGGTKPPCDRNDSAISGKVWVIFDNNVSEVSLDIPAAVAAGLVTGVTSEDDFYATAKQNAAFRVSYNGTNDGNNSLIQLKKKANGDYEILNFTELVQNIGTCVQPVRFNPANQNTTIQVATVCGNSGTAGLSPWGLARCNECLFGYNTTNICSRDNFSIRPESFSLKIHDRDQNNSSIFQLFANDRTGVTTANEDQINLAAGYSYGLDINATNHIDNEASEGYVRYFGTDDADFNLSFIWSPSITANRPTPAIDCNDTSTVAKNVNLYDGIIVQQEVNLSQVGEYRLNMIDKTWTEVDHDPNLMQHHSDPTHFLGGVNGKDCALNTSLVQNSATPTTIAAGQLATINGCDITTENHNNTEANLQYRDYNVSFRPYKFDITGLSLFRGSPDVNQTLLQENAYIYMNSLSENSDDTNMSVRFQGIFSAVGYQNQQLSNFTQSCYAKDVDLDFNTSNIPIVNAPEFEYRLRERNIAGSVIGDDIRGSNDHDNNVSTPPLTSMVDLITLPEGNFTRAMLGSADIELNMNFDRNITIPYNPIRLNYNDLNVTCQNLSECSSQADFDPNHDANGTYTSLGTSTLPLDMTHLYTREHVPRHRTTGATAQVPIYYEFHCDSLVALPTVCTIGDFSTLPDANNSISPNALLSPDDVRWYVQNEHNASVDGNASFTQTRDINGDRLGDDDANFNSMIVNPDTLSATYQYSGNQGYPYKATIEVTTPDWLIYNRYDGSATINNNGNVINQFELEFTQSGNWAGQDHSGTEADTNAASTTNRRIQW